MNQVFCNNLLKLLLSGLKNNIAKIHYKEVQMTLIMTQLHYMYPQMPGLSLLLQ